MNMKLQNHPYFNELKIVKCKIKGKRILSIWNGSEGVHCTDCQVIEICGGCMLLDSENEILSTYQKKKMKS